MQIGEQKSERKERRVLREREESEYVPYIDERKKAGSGSTIEYFDSTHLGKRLSVLIGVGTAGLGTTVRQSARESVR